MNPDQRLLHRIAAAPGAPVALDTLPLFKALRAELLSYDAQAGRVMMACTPGNEFMQGAGILAGGITGTILDLAMALALLGRLPNDQVLATQSYTVNLLEPLGAERLRVEGRVVKQSRRSAFLAASLEREATPGLPCADATSIVAIIPHPAGSIAAATS